MLTEYERNCIEWLKSLGIAEIYPYIENGIECSATSLYEVYYKAVLSYETLEIVDDKNAFYSVNDLKNIENIVEYQNQMGAFYSPFFTKRSDISDEVIKGYTHQQLKDILAKANRKNRGIYYISSINGYTSTTLHDNPRIVKSEITNRPYKERVYGHISVVAAETLRLYDGTELSFSFPFMLKGREVSSSNIYEVYTLAYRFHSNFELLKEQRFYSKQQRRIIKQLRKVGKL